MFQCCMVSSRGILFILLKYDYTAGYLAKKKKKKKKNLYNYCIPPLRQDFCVLNLVQKVMNHCCIRIRLPASQLLLYSKLGLVLDHMAKDLD